MHSVESACVGFVKSFTGLMSRERSDGITIQQNNESQGSTRPSHVLHTSFIRPLCLCVLSHVNHKAALYIIYVDFFLKTLNKAIVQGSINPSLYIISPSLKIFQLLFIMQSQCFSSGCYTPVLLVSSAVCLQRELMAYSPRPVPFSSFLRGFLCTRGKLLWLKTTTTTTTTPVISTIQSNLNPDCGKIL